jgi:hypothetical protein
LPKLQSIETAIASIKKENIETKSTERINKEEKEYQLESMN